MTETPRNGTPRDESTPDDRTPDMWTSAGESLPGLARVAAYAALHTTEWGVKTSAKAWLRVGKAVTRPDEAAALARDASKAMVVVGDLARSVSSGTPVAKALMSAGESLGGLVEANGTEMVNGHVVTSGPPQASLRELGQQLLDRSRDVWNTDEGHPAYERILSELAPDEARILMLLLTGGPQPSVDVRTGGPIGMVSSQLIAPGLTMIGARSGVRYLDQVPAYLNNLFRLGLVWFSREALRDPMHYQVVEAQPDVLEAMHSVKFAKVVRRSIHLTPFGEDFCKTCLVEEETLAVAAFPEHSVPPEVADPRDPGPG
ncbi:Abi-alpha family protein [Nocardioides psychrotolerans]|uniref:Abi-alpha family protein n=1 Tax=Nocardioides psychrotolerans TaxID=1005945 RepID=UPI00313834CA